MKDEDYDPDRVEYAGRRESIPYEYKREVLDYMEKNPTHSIETISRIFPKVRSPSQITEFRRYLGYPGKAPYRYLGVFSFCNKMCDETEASGGVVDDHKIKIWALQKAGELGHMKFGASRAWVAKFRRDCRMLRIGCFGKRLRGQRGCIHWL